MKTLYIVGNGFDLHHRLSTQYSAFAVYLLNHHRERYLKMIEYYSLPDFDDYNLTPREINDMKTEWNEFEERLADLDFQTILDENTDYIPSVSDDDWNSDVHAYQQIMEGIVDDLTRNLFASFREFILQVNFPTDIADRAITMEADSVALSFNYTNTLERYYGFTEEQVLYIHGKASRDENIVLGHSRQDNPMQEEPPAMPEGLSEEDQDRWRDEQSSHYDYSYESGKEELSYYFDESFKHTQDIIAENSSFFESLSEVDRIIVLGHSLGNVDLPYFSQVIRSIAPPAKWTVSWFNDSEQSYKRQVLEGMGVLTADIELIRIEDLRA